MTTVKADPPTDQAHASPAHDSSAPEREERLAERYCSLREAGHSMLEALALATRQAGGGESNGGS